MKDNKNCVLIKRKEYDEMLAKIEELKQAKKPDEIKITFYKVQDNSHQFYMADSLNLTGQLRSQILRIIRNKYNWVIHESFVDYFNMPRKKQKWFKKYILEQR
jgi:hypothetical protein